MFSKVLLVCIAALAMSFAEAKRCCCDNHSAQSAPVTQEAPPATTTTPKKPVCAEHAHDDSAECDHTDGNASSVEANTHS